MLDDFFDFFFSLSKIMDEQAEMLIVLDSKVGDGDLGLTMRDGFSAAFTAFQKSEELDLSRRLFEAGKAMSRRVPSTMGTLMANGIMEGAKSIKNCQNISANTWISFFEGLINGIVHLGKAEPGEKTILDSLIPGFNTLKKGLEDGIELQEAAENAFVSARSGYLATANMLAVHGRAAIYGEGSQKLLDPGAAVGMLIFQAFFQSLQGKSYVKY